MVALLAAFLAAPAWAGTAGIIAQHGKIYETKKAGMETEGFIEIDNGAAAPDTLTSVDCPIADSTSMIGPGGQVIDSLTVAPGQSLTLAADGPHLLLQSTHFSVDAGGAIPCSLTFANAGEISVYLYPVPGP
jgi:copper(I)-binding protein